MHRRKLTVLAIAAIAVAAVGLTGASGATGQLSRFHAIPSGTITGSHLSSLPLALSNKQVSYILELSGKPVAAVDAARKAAGHGSLSMLQRLALTRQLRSQQAPVVAALRQLRGTRVTEQFQGVYNGIAVSIPQREAWKLNSISGVKAVFATKTYKLAAAAPGDGIPLTNAPQAWGGVGSFSGNGIKIADLDTGIDYTHADFGGDGLSSTYQCALASDTADPSTVSCDGHTMDEFYGPNAPKIKGGTDLVGDAYNAAAAPNSPALIPHPDNNPLDCNSHGTHTAGTLAGFGVDGSGHTYAGSYNANTINNTNFIIPPGMAPKASLYAVRVFGCSGSVDDAVLIDAMNWAFNNGMDVVNMSLGAPFGSSNDPDSVAASNLAAEGVITVVASGNNGPNPYITSSPAAGFGALAAAASDSTQSFPAADLTLSTGGPVIKAIDANGATISPATYNELVIPATAHDTALGDVDTISFGCSVADDEAANGGNPLPANTVIVVERGVCARVAKAIFGQQAGAAAVIMVNNSTAYPPYEGPITSDPDAAGPPLFGGFAYQVTIPFVGVQGKSGGHPSTSTAGAALVAANGGTVTFGADTIANPGYLGLASFSSWGPSTGGLMKPEVTAPGVSIVSAGMGTGNGILIDSGTSMATPHTAGLAALVKQADPSWGDVQFWKDAIVNTANTSLVAGYATRGAGAGFIDAFNATHTKVVADGSPAGTSSLSCGVVDVTGKFDCTEDVTLHNFSASKQTFRVSSTTPQGVGHKVVIKTPNTWSPAKVAIPAGGTAVVSVEVIVYKGHSADPVTGFNDWWGGGQFDEASGLIHFAPLNGSNSHIALNVPYYAVPTAVSNVAVSGISSAALAHGATDNNVVLTNKKGNLGYADWFSWGGSSPVSGTDIGSADLLNVGVQSFPDGSGTADSSSIAEFALNTTKSWTNPGEDTAEIDIDVNNDGIPDYAVLGADDGAELAGGVSNGESVVIVINLANGHFKLHYLTGAMFNGTTMELPVQFADLCQSGGACVTDGTAIKYVTFMTDRNGGQDSIGTEDMNTGAITSAAAPFDVFHPSLSNNFEDVVGRNATVADATTIDPTAWSANPQLGILVLMQNNQNTVGEAKTFSLSF